MPATSQPPKIALCIGHPGHELQVFGWMRRNSPVTYVLTDGSGSNRTSRLHSTVSLLRSAGAEPGTLFGLYTDRQFYEMMIRKDSGPFIQLARRLADSWIDAGITAVAGDMLEGFNTTHDVCRMVINAACEYCRVAGRKEIQNFEFPLEEQIKGPARPVDVVIDLPDAEFGEKRHAALFGYPELHSEVVRVFAKHGEDPYRREVLLAAGGPAGLEWEQEKPPYYETFGMRQVAAGHYREVITFREHLRPLAHDLWNWAKSGGV